MVNIEIKARCSNSDRIRKILKSRNARFAGLDHQIDTYFKVGAGKRLKLRQGNIENSLIFYDRPDVPGPKKSDIILINDPPSTLKDLLAKALGILIVVDKEREIYFVEDNVKVHIDIVRNIEGTFVEIEAIDKDDNIGETRLLKHCKYYLSLLGLDESELIEGSYSDMLGKIGPAH